MLTQKLETVMKNRRSSTIDSKMAQINRMSTELSLVQERKCRENDVTVSIFDIPDRKQYTPINSTYLENRDIDVHDPEKERERNDLFYYSLGVE